MWCQLVTIYVFRLGALSFCIITCSMSSLIWWMNMEYMEDLMNINWLIIVVFVGYKTLNFNPPCQRPNVHQICVFWMVFTIHLWMFYSLKMKAIKWQWQWKMVAKSLCSKIYQPWIITIITIGFPVDVMLSGWNRKL